MFHIENSLRFSEREKDGERENTFIPLQRIDHHYDIWLWLSLSLEIFHAIFLSFQNCISTESFLWRIYYYFRKSIFIDFESKKIDISYFASRSSVAVAGCISLSFLSEWIFERSNSSQLQIFARPSLLGVFAKSIDNIEN